jgi:two-component system CheB/CheR fusion protein
VTWILKQQGTTLLDLVWEETGGPPARPPQTTGFGSKVMKRIVTDQLSAEVETQWREQGLRFRLAFDLAPFIPGAAAASTPDQGPPEPSAEILHGKTILVLDDEWLIAEQHADLLVSMGAQVAGPYFNLRDAMAADISAVDAALLDFALDDGNSLPLAHKLQEAGKPFAFVSGYGSAMNLPAPFDKCPVIAKPAIAASILDATARLLARR